MGFNTNDFVEQPHNYVKQEMVSGLTPYTKLSLKGE